MQIGVERRKHGIFGIGGTDIVCEPLHSFRRRSQMSRQASDRVNSLGIAQHAEVTGAGKDA